MGTTILEKMTGTNIEQRNQQLTKSSLLLRSGISCRLANDHLMDPIKWSFANLQEIPDLRSKLLLVSCWFLCSILVPVIFSRMVVPIYLDRYVIGAAPALYLLLAFGIFSTRKVVPIGISLAVLV